MYSSLILAVSFRGVVVVAFETSATPERSNLPKKKKNHQRLLFLHAHREASALAGELTEESDQFRFLRAVCLTNLEGSVVLILVKASAMRVIIPLDLSTWSFIPLPRFFHSRRAPPLLTPSLVLFPQRSA